MDRSPAVDRAIADVEKIARDRGESVSLLIDWITVLLADEDGRPAGLVQRFDCSPIDAIVHATEQVTLHRPAPDVHRLLGRGRELASLLRGDPTLTTDALFLAIVETCETVDGGFAKIGMSLQRLADAFGGNAVEPLPIESPAPVMEFTIADPFETAQLHRLLDAALNRAREALRVVDDYARFALNDRTLTDELKTIRHGLVDALSLLPVSLRHRDTPGDVGTTLGTAAEYHRQSPRDTATVNFKRLQEALRSIEEFGKQISADFARRIESLRYRVYTAEQACLSASSLAVQLAQTTLYVLLTGSQSSSALDWTIREAAAGGAGVFQLREKSLGDRELLDRARAVRRWTRETKTLFIVNDRPDLARLAEADGVHLGQDDLRVAEARKIVGAEMLIGVSTHDVEQLRQAVLEGADYLGVGPVFPSSTKSFDHFPGLDFVREAARLTSKPIFALGGISPANVHLVREAGGVRVAVASAVTQADDPQAAARALASV